MTEHGDVVVKEISGKELHFLRPLSAWIARTQPLPKRFYNPGHVDAPEDDWAVWLSIEEAAPLHLATEMSWLSLSEAREITYDYLASASDLIDGLQGGWLDSEERQWILDALGEPPSPALPIYLIACFDGAREHVVYIGKTKNISRFYGGHSAALKLHSPKYDGQTKKIYRATVWFYDGEDYISLDWIQPETLAHQLLDSIESQLIYHFQPALNTAKRKQDSSQWKFHIHIQNFLAGSFLDDHFL